MRGWVVHRPGPIATGPLVAVDLADPQPASDEILVEVDTCGVCRTDLHLAEGDLPPRFPDIVPGHQAVGRVAAVGAGVADWQVGERVGVAWLRRTCGHCRWCRSGRENLCPGSAYTGWDAHGGFAERAVVPAAWAYRLPPAYDDEHVAPLLCAGIIGFRALRRSGVPQGGRLGVWGMGASAHLAVQVAVAEGTRVHVFTRSERGRRLGLDLGATTAQESTEPTPEPLDAAVLFAPDGTLVPVAMAALERGGTLAVAGIHLTAVASLDYRRHLFEERTLTSVTANTRADGRALLDFAARHPLRVATTAYPLAAADRALADLAAGRVGGAAVLHVR